MTVITEGADSVAVEFTPEGHRAVFRRAWLAAHALARAQPSAPGFPAGSASGGRPEFRLTLRLAAGDCLIFDNTRVLHARTAFTVPSADVGTEGAVPEDGAGERHLQGCYADIDGLLSALAVLRRPKQRDETREVG